MPTFFEPTFSKDALTFDDVLMLPGHSDIMPGNTDLRTRVTNKLSLNLPIISFSYGYGN